MRHIALFGAAGQVGSDCHQQLINTGYEVSPLTRKDADFATPDAVAAVVAQQQPDLVINACAYTAVDKAEEEQQLADQVNHLSVDALATACAQSGIPLIQLSTDYVFDGTGQSPYREDDPVQPLGTYGKTKLLGEQAIRDKLADHIVLRTSWVFGEHGNNFVKTMLRVGAERDQLKVVDDQRGRPTYAGDIVSAILAFVNDYRQQGTLPWGTYHCSSEGETTWYGFAKAIFATAEQRGVLARQPEVLPIPSSDYPTPAPRPAYSVLATDKLTQFMGTPLPHWQQGLDKFFSHRHSS